MSKIIKFALLLVLGGLLVLIRVFEDQLFYDPYITFFENDYLYLDSPRQETLKLVLFTLLRYGINTIISLAVLYVIFRDRSIVKFSAVVYGVALVILTSLFLYFVINPKQEEYYLFFNIRRFLIQPLILLLLIPAFYYHKQRS